jgi:hypothetical protein
MSSASGMTTPLPYVIVGCGFAATVNRAMLLQNPASLVHDRPLIHIGDGDPWSTYEPVEMGQWPLLLTLPAYSIQPSGYQYQLMRSSHFAWINGSQWTQHAPAISQIINDRVADITDDGTHYTLTLKKGAPIEASRVDICAGPGPAREIPPSLHASSILASALSPKPLLYAEEYLHQLTARVENKRVCVVGGGATGAWCVELAQSLGNTVTWLADKKLNEAFVSSKRNDGLLVPPVTRKLVGGTHVVDGDIRPLHLSTTFGEHVEVTGLSLTGALNSEVAVSYASSPSGPSVFTTTFGTPSSILTNTDFDQVVWATGQATGLGETGSWADILEPILNIARGHGSHLIVDGEQRVVGLQSDRGDLRVLGATALAHPDVRKEWEAPGTASNLFFRSLVEQARVSVGITLAAVTIGAANNYWAGRYNPSLNTASLKDMKKMMASWPKPLDGPETWFELRAARVHPFEAVELARLLTQQFTY